MTQHNIFEEKGGNPYIIDFWEGDNEGIMQAAEAALKSREVDAFLSMHSFRFNVARNGGRVLGTLHELLYDEASPYSPDVDLLLPELAMPVSIYDRDLKSTGVGTDQRVDGAKPIQFDVLRLVKTLIIVDELIGASQGMLGDILNDEGNGFSTLAYVDPHSVLKTRILVLDHPLLPKFFVCPVIESKRLNGDKHNRVVSDVRKLVNSFYSLYSLDHNHGDYAVG